MPSTLNWKNIEDIALALVEAHPERDPLSVRFTELKGLVLALPNFREEAGHPVNEQILEAIQAAWHEEAEEAKANDEDDAEDAGGRGYKPNNPFRG